MEMPQALQDHASAAEQLKPRNANLQNEAASIKVRRMIKS
jgi:hypothetical protein